MNALQAHSLQLRIRPSSLQRTKRLVESLNSTVTVSVGWHGNFVHSSISPWSGGSATRFGGVHTGSLMATGSADASMKVLGVGKVSQFACASAAGIGTRALSQFEARAMQMLNFAQTGRSSDEFAGAQWKVLRHCERAALNSLTRCLTCYLAAAKPVLRTLYNHTQVRRPARCLASSVTPVPGWLLLLN